MELRRRSTAARKEEVSETEAQQLPTNNKTEESSHLRKDCRHQQSACAHEYSSSNLQLL